MATSCKNEEKKKSTNALSTAEEIKLPPLPEAEYNLLYDECDFIDYIFIELPFSISQDDKESIQNNVVFVSKEEVSSYSKSCKPIARKFFKIKGKIVWEADVFKDSNCAHFVFYKDNKAMYANKMSQSGINFYNNLIDQAQKLQPGSGQ